VLDPYDATRFGPITMTLGQADHRLRGLLRGVLEAIDVTARGVSPRIVSAELVGSAGTTTVSGVELAAALGLQSTWDCFAVSTSMATSRPAGTAPARSRRGCRSCRTARPA
jgi:stage II sporulation protein D